MQSCSPRRASTSKRGSGSSCRPTSTSPNFVEMVVEELYRAGAGRVVVEWSHQPLAKLNYKYADEKLLSVLQKWEERRSSSGRRTNFPPCSIWNLPIPTGSRASIREKFTACRTARTKVTKPYRDRMECKYQWCIAAVPGKAWAKKVFPDLMVNKARSRRCGITS